VPELKIDTGPQKNQVFFLRPPGPYHVGRDEAAEVPLFDRRASRSHCRIDFRDDGYRITDLDSKAGTLLNDVRVASEILRHGDRLIVGRTALTFSLDETSDPLVGRVLGGYRILERVGRGGMGTVYRALQLSLDRVVALKVLSNELSQDPEFSALFVREARAAAELSHPHLVRVYDVNVLDGVIFYVMEFMAHGSVEDSLRRQGRLSLEDALRVAAQAAAGLEYAEHENLVHRDIKPANLMVHENGTVKIGDLGIATRGAEHAAGSKPGAIAGSPQYMAPEQALGRAVDSRADVYALGATLHELLVGAPLFRGETLREMLFAHVRTEPPDLRVALPEAPEGAAMLLKNMLAKDPARRPDPQAVRQGIDLILASLGARTAEPRRRRAPWWLPYASLVLAAAIVLSLGVATGLFSRHIGSVLSERNARGARIRQALEDGLDALRSGDLARARRRADELANLPGSEDDWKLFEAEFERFRRALDAAESDR